MQNIRNFAIIAHIDHGKSTLADRLLEICGLVKAGQHEEQMLDRNPISRERGITIKLAPVRLNFTLNSQFYTLNLIDTPGHVDFSYEVDRTLACVEGVLLLVDATQGIQAQTIANAYKALDKNLVIIPVINKIDLGSADVPKCKKQLVDFLGVKDNEIYEISAKTGQGVEALLKGLIEKIPPPPENSQLSIPNSQFNLRALIFDSYYDPHRGVIAFIRMFNGNLKKGMKVRLSQAGESFDTLEVGIFLTKLTPVANISAGEIAYVATNLKDIHQVRVGDMLIDSKSVIGPITGYKTVKPMLYASVFTTDTADFLNLKKALEKLYLNDSSLLFSTINSKALGAGFRVGFLGLLHADVVRERLEREFNLSIVLTPPQVDYKIENNKFFEPYVKILIITPEEYMGSVMNLAKNYRAKFINMDNTNQISLTYEMPLSEMISDFFDNLKSVSSGYASLDWEFIRYEEVKADKMSILINLDEVEEFSEIVDEARSYDKASVLVVKLKDIIPRQQYEVKIQAKYKGKIIASSRISPFRKNVLMKSGKTLGAGDVGRRNMLLDRQKEGKKNLKMVGHVEIPKDAFLKLFKK